MMDSSHLVDLYRELSQGESTQVQEISDEITKAYSHIEILPIICELLSHPERDIQLSAAIGWKCCYKRHKSDLTKRENISFLEMLVNAMKNCFFEILEMLIPCVAELSDKLDNYEMVNELAAEYISEDKTDHLIELYSEFGPHINIDTPILQHIIKLTINNDETRVYMEAHVIMVAMCQETPDLVSPFTKIKSTELLHIIETGNEERFDQFATTAGFLMKNRVHVIDYDFTLETLDGLIGSNASLQMRLTAASLFGEIVGFVKPSLYDSYVKMRIDTVLELTAMCYNPEYDQFNQINDPSVLSALFKYFPEKNELIEVAQAKINDCLEKATEGYVYAMFVMMNVLISDYPQFIEGNIEMFLEIIVGLLEEIGLEMETYTLGTLSQLATLDTFSSEADVYELVSLMIQIFKESGSCLALDTASILLTQIKLSEDQFADVFKEIAFNADDDEPITYTFFMKFLYSLIGANKDNAKAHSIEIFDILASYALSSGADVSGESIFVIEKLLSICNDLMESRFEDIESIISENYETENQIQKKAIIALMGSVISYGSSEQWGIVLERFESLVEETRELIDEADQYDVSGLLFAYYVLYAKMIQKDEFMMKNGPYSEMTNVIIELTTYALQQKSIVECGLIVARQYTIKSERLELQYENSLEITSMLDYTIEMIKKIETEEELDTITKYISPLLDFVIEGFPEHYLGCALDAYIEKLAKGMDDLPHIRKLVSSLENLVRACPTCILPDYLEKLVPLVNGGFPAQVLAFNLLRYVEQELLEPFQHDIIRAAIYTIRNFSEASLEASVILAQLSSREEFPTEFGSHIIELANCSKRHVQSNCLLAAVNCDIRHPFLTEEQRKLVFSGEIDRRMIVFWANAFLNVQPLITQPIIPFYIKGLVRLLSCNQPDFVELFIGFDKLSDLMEIYMPFRDSPWLKLTKEEAEAMNRHFFRCYM